MGDEPMPTKGLQQSHITVNVLTEFCGDPAWPWHVGKSGLFCRLAWRRGGQGCGLFWGCGGGLGRNGWREWYMIMMGWHQSSGKKES
jgi:hypothetical protein